MSRGNQIEVHHPSGITIVMRHNPRSCILEFDGACRGNPGPAGAGAILRSENGNLLYRFREGLGYQTNNVAEYRALILGLKQAARKGYQNIIARGDSKLVVNQFNGDNNINNARLRNLCNEVLELKHNYFHSLIIQYIPRENNTEADAQANRAVSLGDGQVEEDRMN